MALVEKLVGDDGVLTAVGDDDQSIYACGAKVENILNFPKTFPGCRVSAGAELPLGKTRPDLATKSSVKMNPEMTKSSRPPAKNQARSGSGFNSPETEAEFIAREIKRAIRSGEPRRNRGSLPREPPGRPHRGGLYGHGRWLSKDWRHELPTKRSTRRRLLASLIM